MKNIVLDTNCLVQIISMHSPYRAIWKAFLMKRFTLCFSDEILNEYQEILERYTSVDIAQNVISLLLNSSNVRFITPHYRFGLITKDPDDNKFVDCAITANAEYLVSEDSHFNVLKKAYTFPTVKVIRMKAFKEELEKEAMQNPDA